MLEIVYTSDIAYRAGCSEYLTAVIQVQDILAVEAVHYGLSHIDILECASGAAAELDIVQVVDQCKIYADIIIAAEHGNKIRVDSRACIDIS